MEHGQDSPLQIDVGRDGVVATVTVTGELDITTATPLTQCLLAVAAEHPERLGLDPSGLGVAHAAGARALGDAHTLVPAVGPGIVRQARPPTPLGLGVKPRK